MKIKSEPVTAPVRFARRVRVMTGTGLILDGISPELAASQLARGLVEIHLRNGTGEIVGVVRTNRLDAKPGSFGIHTEDRLRNGDDEIVGVVRCFSHKETWDKLLMSRKNLGLSRPRPARFSAAARAAHRERRLGC